MTEKFDTLIRNQFNELKKVHKDLVVNRTSSGYEINGFVSFKTNIDGVNVEDKYLVLIKIPPSYPDDYPKVFEVGGRIDKIPDNHVYPETGMLCLGTNIACLIAHFKSKNLLKFVHLQLVPYLAGYSIYNKYGYWPHGEYSHGNKGVFEYYKDYFEVYNPEVITLLIGMAVNWRTLSWGKSLSCICKSGRTFGGCHYELVRKLSNPRLKHIVETDYVKCSEYLKKIETEKPL